MKKVLKLTILAAILFVACGKDNAESCHSSWNRVVPSDSKTASSMVLFVHIGHEAKGCNGCVYTHGEWIHVDCMGFGNYCATSSSVQLQQVGTALTATTTDTFDLTSEDFFLMPDRSLEFEVDKGVYEYLNIPEQLVWRDSATLQFTFTGLSFTSIPLYYNN